MNFSLVNISTFCAGALAAGGLCSLCSDLFLRERVRLSRRLKDEFGAADEASGKSIFRDLDQLSQQAGRTEPGLKDRLETVIEQSGLQTTVRQIVAASLSLSGLAAAGLYLPWGNLWIAVGAALLALPLPLAVVVWLQQRRVHKLCRQLPQAFAMMSRAVRGGQTVTGAMQVVAQDLEPPLGKEFAHCCNQQNLGIPVHAALRELGRRCGVMELRMFVVTFLVQRRSGGSPVEVIENLTQVVSKRLLLKSKVKALTGEARMQALVLLVLPLVMFVVVLAVNYSYSKVLLERPWLLVGVLIWQAIGAAWIRRIVRIDY